MRIRKIGERYLIRLEPEEEVLTTLRTWAQNDAAALCRSLGHRGYASGRCWAL
ncbi:MAG: hypothetical protein RMK65_07220 [Anaerolineae bacterium]|nr:hypothetical protein [Anaerolineae bacterium]